MSADIHYLPLTLTDFREHNPMAEKSEKQIVCEGLDALREMTGALRIASSARPEVVRQAFTAGSGYMHILRRVRADLDFIERTIR